MQTKLTLRLNAELIKKAKTYARQKDTSLSRLVEKYFSILGKMMPSLAEDDLPPITRSLWGLLEGISAEEHEYQDYLEEKHR
jgi:hypothetical protein